MARLSVDTRVLFGIVEVFQCPFLEHKTSIEFLHSGLGSSIMEGYGERTVKVSFGVTMILRRVPRLEGAIMKRNVEEDEYLVKE